MSFLKGFNGGFNSSFSSTNINNVVTSNFTWKAATFTWGKIESVNQVTTTDNFRAPIIDSKITTKV